ncbi:MAG: hypothetical protein RSD07_12875, partial [Angelakisella sp.]
MTITRNKKLLAGGLAVAICISGAMLYPASAASKGGDQQGVYKETVVGRGNVTAGVTESGNASLEAIALTYDNYTSNSSDDSNTVKALVEEV